MSKLLLAWLIWFTILAFGFETLGRQKIIIEQNITQTKLLQEIKAELTKPNCINAQELQGLGLAGLVADLDNRPKDAADIYRKVIADAERRLEGLK